LVLPGLLFLTGLACYMMVECTWAWQDFRREAAGRDQAEQVRALALGTATVLIASLLLFLTVWILTD
jgi:hypothetical protein